MSNNSTSEEITGEKEKPQKGSARELLEALLVAFLLAIFIRTFFVQAFKIPSGSMKDTLLVGDHILVTKYSYGIHIPNEILFTDIRLFSDIVFFQDIPERFDVIVFKFPKNESVDYIKRVIALPGETLEIRRQEIYINGKKLEDPHAHHTMPVDLDGARDNYGPIRIPEGHVFMMGDNRENSRDSRFWGVLDVKKIRGKARRIYWSWETTGDCFLCGRVRWDRLFNAIE
ncbi:MAG: signal peptidase I [Candidatus Nitronauta litoralis]|uniref:Signal peptidase I n=1 Tax=Candidatus Nitronauta litoralis TaxID=2705533 RepID=A0A7T0BWI5_9BACT|nr:MAG: signal peptidase I [Candidatus Nitronauta litoralis]